MHVFIIKGNIIIWVFLKSRFFPNVVSQREKLYARNACNHIVLYGYGNTGLSRENNFILSEQT